MRITRDLEAQELLELIFIYLTEISSLKVHDDIIIVLADMGRALTGADRCSVWIVDKEIIWTKVSQGMDAIELPIHSGIVGDSIRTGKKTIIDDVYQDKRFNAAVDKKTGYVTKSMMVIPMFDNDYNIIGAFQVINHTGNRDIFDERDMQRLMLASTYGAESIISAMLTSEIEETQREVVFTMGAIGESRSKETGNHVKRVAQYSKIMALAYGLDEAESEMLKQVSPMHDIGKVAIPDAILNKPGRFDEEERKIMDTHAQLGFEMTSGSERPLLKAASIVAHEHHEKWNGSGYPQGKEGEDIHIYGRITAIADVFDALGSDRVYKKAWSDEKIFKLFREENGKHFDPKLVEIFFANLNEILEVRETFKDEYKVEKIDVEDDNKIQILGAFGTKSKGYGTSAVFLNKKNVIDAGNLLEPLNVDSIEIENIWLTHSHLDHIVDIAYILDNYFGIRKKSLNIIGLPETIDVIKKHFLNNVIWPDFSKIKLSLTDEMAVTYTEVEINKDYKIGNGESIRAFLTDHTVDSCGYVYKKGNSSVLITADTLSLNSLKEEIEKDISISTMIIECSFPNELENLAIKSKHLTPKLLFSQLENVKRDDLMLYINHIKPSYIKMITDEIEENRGRWSAKILKDGEFINF